MRVLILLGFGFVLFGQETFDIRTQLVLVPVTVQLAAKGGFVNGLEGRDFTLLDNGKPVPIQVDSIGTGVAPVALVVAVQTSGISSAVLEKVHKIGSMIRPLVLGERGLVAVVAFDTEVRWLQDWTSDEGKISAAFADVRSKGVKEARLLDAAQEAIVRLGARKSSRRILLLISESRDRSSEADLDSVAFAAQQAGVVVYAAQYSAFRTGFTRRSPESAGPAPRDQSGRPNPEHGTPSGAPPKDKYDPKMPPPAQRVDILGALGELGRLGKDKATEILAQETGGLTFTFARQKALEDAIEKFGADLHAQYVLSFTPKDPEPGYHRLEVRVAREKAVVRSRPGYWAAGVPVVRTQE
jgi:VWFA-related protein